MTDNTIHVLVIEPGKKPYEKDIGSDLASLQNAVGGYIQAVYPYIEPVGLVVDEEGKLSGKELNRALRDEDGDIYDVIVGTFLVVGLGAEDFASLSPELCEQFKAKFAVPEAFLVMNGRMVCIPISTD